MMEDRDMFDWIEVEKLALRLWKGFRGRLNDDGTISEELADEIYKRAAEVVPQGYDEDQEDDMWYLDRVEELASKIAQYLVDESTWTINRGNP
jgi:hypothetical protein